MFEYLFIELDSMRIKIYYLIQKIMNIIKDLKVSAVTLVTKNEKPAVEKAETGFSIFKIFNKKNLISKTQKSKLDNIISKLDKTLKESEDKTK